jgi:transcription antitermination factor NusG
MLALSQNAIVRCISFLGKPAVIPEWQIESLKKMLSEAPEVFISDKIHIGTKVQIMEGPFKDIVGIVTEEQEDKWLAVCVEIVHRSVMVRLPKESTLKIL